MTILYLFFLSFVSEDICPMCLGELDTGFECNSCNFDVNTLLEEREDRKY